MNSDRTTGTVKARDVLVLMAALLIVCVIGGLEVGMPTAGRILSSALTVTLLVAALYWTSPRFQNGRVTRSFADFGRWVGECATSLLRLTKTFLGWAVAIAILWGLTIGAYRIANDAGWIAHTHDTPVWIRGDWLVGEFRYCQMLTTTPRFGGTMPPSISPDFPRMFCGTESAGGVAEFVAAVPEQDYNRAFNAAEEATMREGDWAALDMYFHVLPVRYFGRIQRPDTWLITWRCQRENRSLECRALD